MTRCHDLQELQSYNINYDCIYCYKPPHKTNSVTEVGNNKAETYTGVTANTFKKRYGAHCSDMRHEKYRSSTCLSKHVWGLKDQGKNFSIQWRLVDRSSSFNPITQKCRICLKEKKEILYNRDGSSLNKRNKIFSTCRHRKTRLLCNVKTWDLFN